MVEVKGIYPWVLDGKGVGERDGGGLLGSDGNVIGSPCRWKLGQEGDNPVIGPTILGYLSCNTSYESLAFLVAEA